MIKPQVGMRVLAGTADYNKNVHGKTGRVLVVDNRETFGIVFDKNIEGHNLGGRCIEGCGWWMRQESFSVIGCESEEFE